MASPKVLLILGSGPNIGAATATLFSSKGYKIATTSRKPHSPTHGPTDLHIQADLSNPTSIPQIFTTVTTTLGPPSTILYNAAALIPVPPTDPLSLPLSDLQTALNITTLSPYASAQSALQSFATLPASLPKTFLYTGNILPRKPSPSFLSLGVGKTAAAHWIQIAHEAYRDRGWGFYYVDERKEDGSSGGRGISGNAHADFFWGLVEGGVGGRGWEQTFVAGLGFKGF